MWAFGAPAHLLQKLDLILQELVNVLRLLLSILKLAPELGFMLAVESLRVSPGNTERQVSGQWTHPGRFTKSESHR